MFNNRHLDVSIDKKDIWIQIDESPDILRLSVDKDYRKFMEWLSDPIRSDDIKGWFSDIVEFFKFVVMQHKEVIELSYDRK